MASETLGTGMIVVGGEALVDLVPAAGEGSGASGALVPRLGGGPFNIAVALGRLAAPVGLLAVVSVQPDGSAAYTFYTAGTAMVAFTDPGPLPATVAAVSLGSLGLLLEP